ncbi:MAG: DHA2 family efflux MFS transporter permease subunit [Solirubrobacterales bacterium]|nr:DHA2 family efflux MFS transporter permease subunit [Solirubrobacterales bacterium]
MNQEHGPAISNRQRTLVLAAMCVALGTVVSAVSSLNVALPDLARDLGATQTQLQWIVDSYAVVFAGLLLLAGALGDRIGRRPVLLAGLAAFALASAAGMLVDDPGALVAVRAVMGLGAAAIMPSTLSIITNVFPPAERDRAVSIWAGVAGGSALLGLLVSGALLEAFSWESIFAFSAVLGLLALLAAARVAPDSKLDRARLDAVGGILSALGLSALVYGIIEGPERGWTDGLTVAAFAIALIALAAFVAWELRRDEPLLDPRLFRLPGFGAGSVSMAVQFFAFFGFIFVILQYVQFVLGYSPFEAGLALAPIAILMMGLSPRAPRLLERFGPARVGPLGLLLMAGGFAVFSALGVDSGYWLLLAGLLLLGTGAALATTPATTAIVSSLPQSKQGVASAVNDAAREVGGALGIAVLGSALADRYQAGIPDAIANAPADLVERAHDALPAALALAERLGAQGAGLAGQAQAAFVDGLGLAMLIAAAALAVAAGFVLWRAPSEVTAPPEEEARAEPGRRPVEANAR